MGPMTGALATALEAYDRAAAEFRTRAERVPPALWDRPRREGKWSPAEETEHIVLSHELFFSQLGGGPAMRVIATGWRLTLLRALILPYILRTGRFPRARAPRESRPVSTGAGREALLARLDCAVRGAIDLVRHEGTSIPRLRHPYFGMLNVTQVVRLSTVHTRHHLANLPVGAGADGPASEARHSG
jgi:hypothetical protein